MTRFRQWLRFGACVVLGAGVVLAGCDAGREAADATGGPSLNGIRYLSGGPESAGFEQAIAPRNYFSFPADHADHPGFRTEWWYFTGNVFGSNERHFGFELTMFRVALAPAPVPALAPSPSPPSPPPRESTLASNDVWMAHLTVTDTAGRQFLATERLSRGATGIAGVASGGITPGSDRAGGGRSDESLLVRVEDFTASFDGNRVLLAAGDAEFGIDLELTGLERIVAQGNNGLDPKGPEPGNASYYFSAPRLAVQGEVRLADAVTAVEGTAWMDREWSTSALSPDIEGWDWFALQLDDGRDLMFYRLRRFDGTTSEFSGGSITSAGGSVRRLDAGSIELTVLREWTSERTGVRYPVAWNLALPALDLELAVRPRLDDQEVDLSVRYWEGAVTVEGTADGEPLGGVGYLELAGY